MMMMTWSAQTSARVNRVRAVSQIVEKFPISQFRRILQKFLHPDPDTDDC